MSDSGAKRPPPSDGRPDPKAPAGSKSAPRTPKVPYRQVGSKKAAEPKAAEPKSPGTKSPGTKSPGTKSPGTKSPEPTAPEPTAPEPTADVPEAPVSKSVSKPPESTAEDRRTPGSAGAAPPGRASKVTVTVGEAQDAEALAEQLRAEGMTVDQVLSEVGIITGSVPDDQKSSIGGIEGVDAVEDEITFQLPPPEAGIQ